MAVSTSRYRRKRVASKIMDAVEAALEADTAAEAEKWAKSLTVLTGAMKTAESLMPQAASGAAAPSPEQVKRLRDQFNTEVDRLVEQRIQERLRSDAQPG